MKLANDHSLNISNYVPHHGLLNINKPGWVRSGQVNSSMHLSSIMTHLNQNLLPGPDLLHNLVSALIRFHQGKYAVMSDIEKMFHPVFLSPKDTDALIFLWRESPDDHKMLVHIFGKVHLPCCAN